MKDSGAGFVERQEDAVEALLEQAPPRPTPPAADEEIVREAVRAEWQAVTGKRRSRRRVVQFAIAATVLLAVAISFNAFRVSGIAPVEVATISKEHGSIYLLSEQSEMKELPDLVTISAGQTIVTGDGAGIGLTWVDGGGSLRLDENTHVEFTSSDSVHLKSGRIYYDSQPASRVAGIDSSSAPVFVTETKHGSVTHLGTQYMTAVDDRTLTVSVREGEVDVDGRYTAYQGQQLRLDGSSTPSITNFNSSGAEWAWVEETSPSVDLDGRSTYEFLRWVGRETGLEVEYASAGAATKARAGKLNGTVNMPPREALEIWMAAWDLDVNIDGGTISVSETDSGNRP